MVAASGLWKVVGGASKGGIIVRVGKDVASPEEEERLATGALVRALDHDEGAQRLLFEKVAGTGPASGWVSTVFKGRDMLARTSEENMEEEDASALVMQLYCQRFGQAEDQEGVARPAWNRKSFTWKTEEGALLPQPEEQVRADLQRDLKPAAAAKPASQRLASCFLLCSHCQLPIGEMAYSNQDTKQQIMHGECAAQCLLRDIKEREHDLLQKEASVKKERREEFDIGWKVARIPRNALTAARLQACPVSRGMCCLVVDERTSMVGVAPTMEPAAAVNLEYLSIALEVRRRGSREPLFSLDPVDPQNPTNSMQVKRFEPAWLAGTSAGEVLFQSDYHLKELSMGEYEQPVIGMKSCLDYSDGDEQDGWKAREWFVVRKAEVQMTDDNVIIPYVKMGVEAREQVLGERGLEDVRTTRQDHPLVKYAESFTHNFDLIAERKSVVHHLRELAKASVLAKFIAEAELGLDDSWFAAAGEADEACCLEIPQLWNERCHSQIRVQDGEIVNADSGFSTSFKRLYGGVQFGLDRFQLAGARQPARMMSAGLAARQFVQPARHLSATLSAGLATRQFQRSFGPMGVQPTRVAGVDLNLDEFNLSAPARLEGAVQLSAGVDISGAFWANLGDGGSSAFSPEDRGLLKSVFHPSLSDRREEGDLFTPPDTSFAYVQGLRALIKEENDVRTQRKQEFCAGSFDLESPGLVFPSSWRSSVEVSRQEAAGRQGRALQPRPDYKAQASLFEPALKEAAPVFDKSAEDGTRFRVYRLGSLEVRTTQDLGGEELVGAVFSLRAAGAAAAQRPQAVGEGEKVVKATEYVEGSANGPHCYVVLETESKNVIVMEQMLHGGMKWEVNPKDLEDRNSLAKVLRSAECGRTCLTAGNAMRLQDDPYGGATGKRTASFRRK